MKTILISVAALALFVAAGAGPAWAAEDAKPVKAAPAADKESQEAIAAFLKADSGLKTFFDGAVGYAIFPAVAKGAFGIGAAHGDGSVFEKGQRIGQAWMTQVTIGLALGGQSYSELIFFETPEAFDSFKKSELEFSAQVSAVAAAEGASSNAKYQRSVAVFTLTRGGLMYEASLGGQKFRFKPLAR